ncbi:transcription factor E2F6 [Cheilinus undulatus]|uniref:transcription factor E2F6 n=1 Tax=Cheilinus undulatus TaxID=241271 RepID=UPI001BD36D9B|nr:transcription factor E2F6 [Cheilinus undulatus]
MKCVVTGCPNRSVNTGLFRQTPKRFFDFPEDPARVKIWLAALRETDKVDPTEQHQICEDHFLPEDISTKGINPGAIPIMPPCLDEQLISPWAADMSEEEDEQWGAGGYEEEEDEGGDYAPPLPTPPQKVPAPRVKHRPEPASTSAASSQMKPPMRTFRQDVSLGTLTRGFLDLLEATPDGCVDIGEVVKSLGTRRRRVYDVTNVMDGIRLLEKKSKNKFKWTGRCSISGLKNSQKQKELENMKKVENTLDVLIKSCARQLFDMTDNKDNAAWAYVTVEDISRLSAFQEQTVIVVKAPEETKLEIPTPREDGIQAHLKALQGAIMVVTCEVDTGEGVTSDPEEKNKLFKQLEESRIKTTLMQTETPSAQGAVQSA